MKKITTVSLVAAAALALAACGGPKEDNVVVANDATLNLDEGAIDGNATDAAPVDAIGGNFADNASVDENAVEPIGNE